MRMIIVNKAGDKYLAHTECTHYWTADRTLAMEYSKFEVAQGLAEKFHGTVTPA